VRNGVLAAGLGIASAAVSFFQRRGRRSLEVVTIAVFAFFGFVSGLAAPGSDGTIIVCTVLFLAYLFIRMGKEPDDER